MAQWELIIYVGEDCDGLRKKKGDIIDVRKPLGILGKKEAINHKLLLIEGLEESEAMRLKDKGYIDGKYSDEKDIDEISSICVCKRRHNINLDKVKNNLSTKIAIDITKEAFIFDKILSKEINNKDLNRKK